MSGDVVGSVSLCLVQHSQWQLVTPPSTCPLWLSLPLGFTQIHDGLKPLHILLRYFWGGAANHGWFVLKWYRQQWSEGVSVCGVDLQRAEHLLVHIGFKYSEGSGIINKAVTGTPDTAAVEPFVQELKDLVEEENLHLFNADETGLALRALPRNTQAAAPQVIRNPWTRSTSWPVETRTAHIVCVQLCCVSLYVYIFSCITVAMFVHIVVIKVL